MAKKQIVAEQPNAEQFPKALLVKSQHLATFGLNVDILKALLPNEYYSIDEAKEIVTKYINSFRKMEE